MRNGIRPWNSGIIPWVKSKSQRCELLILKGLVASFLCLEGYLWEVIAEDSKVSVDSAWFATYTLEQQTQTWVTRVKQVVTCLFLCEDPSYPAWSEKGGEGERNKVTGWVSVFWGRGSRIWKDLLHYKTWCLVQNGQYLVLEVCIDLWASCFFN